MGNRRCERRRNRAALAGGAITRGPRLVGMDGGVRRGPGIPVLVRSPSLRQLAAILPGSTILMERVIPPEILGIQTPSSDEAQRRLIGIAGRALGVATETDLRDYFRLQTGEARGRIAELVETGELSTGLPLIIGKPIFIETRRYRGELKRRR